MKKTVTFLLTLFVTMLGFAVQAQAPQTGVYRIQNVGTSKYVKVNGRYDATPNQDSQSKASDITVGIERKLEDGSYRLNSLASTYGDNNRVEVYDYIARALQIGETVLREVLTNSADSNVQKAVKRMNELVKEHAYMSIKPVDGEANTYYAIAKAPTIPSDVVTEWDKKYPNYESQYTDYDNMWGWCIDQVYNYLGEGNQGTDQGLADKIINNLKNIKEGYTYMLTGDPDGTFGYVEIGETASHNTSATLVYEGSNPEKERTWWKLTPKVNTANVKDGTYKAHNLGSDKWVKIESKYYARPNYPESEATPIRATLSGRNENGDQKVINLGATYKENGQDVDIEIYDYIEKAIYLGKIAIASVLAPNNNNGVNPASGENIAYAQQVMEDFVKDNAFMSIKPVEGKEAIYAYAKIPVVPDSVALAMKEHGALDGLGMPLETTEQIQDAAWQYGVNYVKSYLSGELPGISGTDNTLSSYILANIDNIKPGVTYYLGAHQSDGTFDYYPKGAGAGVDADFAVVKDDLYYQWGFSVENVEEDNLTSGTYKVRNVETGHYVEVLSKYYAKPDTIEAGATEIHITYNGKNDDGSYKVTNMSAVAKDGSQCDIRSYIDKAIMVAKAAIASVLSGEEDSNAHVASGENIQYAKQYLEDFVNEHAYMCVKPVVGTNYVYAYATIPEIPDTVFAEMKNHGVIGEDATKDDAWQYGVDYVMSHLEGHNSTLVQLITNNIGRIKQGHTYYLSEDAEKTFDIIDTQDENFSFDNKLMQWGIDLEEEDQPVVSDFYKIHNVGKDKYVRVESMYYAKVDADEDDATPIQVEVAEQLEDGSYKVTNLVGDGHNIQSYVDHAIELGNNLIDKLLAGENSQYGPSSPEHIQEAKARMEEFVKASAYMRIRKVPGEEDAYYAYASAPVIPDDIVTEWRKKVPTSEFSGTMWKWCVAKVKEYLADHSGQGGTNSTLVSLIMNNIDDIEEGHTYYLSAEQDGTFGYKDANEMDFTNQDFWWGFADAVKGEPVSGYFRIKNASGDYYVNVTGPFVAQPNKTQAQAMSLPGTIIYVGMDEKATGDAFRVNTLRSQGVNANAYFNAITTVIDEVSTTAAQVIQKKVQGTSYAQYANLVGPAIEILKEGIDVNAYAEPTLTSDGQDAFMLKATVPDLAEYCDLATFAMDMVGLTKEELVTKLQQKAEASTSDLGKLAYGLAAKIANYIDDPETMWGKIVSNLTNPENEYYQLIVDLGLPEDMVAKALSNLQKIHYGTTYCISRESDGSFDLIAHNDAKNDDACKWILEPADLLEISKAGEHNPDYEVVEDDEGNQATIQTDGQGYNWTTLYVDFDMELAGSDKAYKVISSQVLTMDKNNMTYKYYIVNTEEIEGTVPAQTPVLLRTSNEKFLLTPTGTPDPETAISSQDYVNKILGINDYINSMLGGGQKAPRMRAEGEEADDNLLVGKFFNTELEEDASSQYYVLKDGKANFADYGEDQMQGLGFWKQKPLTELEGNRAYLDPTGLEGYDEFVSSDNDDPNYTSGYILSYDDNGSFVTSIDITDVTKNVVDVRYYNVAGIESNKPFIGVNIVVTTFDDGSKIVTKIIK